MSITKIAALRIGNCTHRYLTEKPRTGAVVSTFRHGFNVLFDEDSDPGFVSFQTQDVPLHPWGIAAEAVGHVRVGDLAVVESNRIRFNSSGVAVDFSDADVDELSIPPWTQEEAARAQERISIIREILAKELAKRVPDPFQPQIDAILERWSETADPEVLSDLVGLGSGSTPSGDDMLVGLLAGFTAFGEVSSEAKVNLTILRQILHADKSQRTTQPSAQMINAACTNSFPEPACCLLRVLGLPEGSTQLSSAIASVLSLGSLSGIAIVSGLLVATVIVAACS
ncbi:DUF2877 domain-containing protein [Candidatus Bipolaricaulota bacterium]|nr:DUF2877 domain-containing protein [Candidatus Bipolaricaulota bacterium]